MTNYFSKIDPYELSLAGNVFSVSGAYSFSGSETKYLQIITAAKSPVILHYRVSSSAEPLKVTAIENPTVTNGTTAVTPCNLNRLLATTPVTTFKSDPTSISGGTTLHVEIVTAGKGAGASSDESGAWTLKKNTKYVWKLEQLTNQATTVVVELMFAETIGTED